MKLSFYDLGILFLMNTIGGFSILYLLAWKILPEHPSIVMAGSVMIFSLCVTYLDVRLFLLMINYEMEKNK